MTAYYNEIDPAAAHLLRCLIEDGVIAPGDVDERSIADVQPEDLKGYTQCHFFAGGGLWSVAARVAGWPDDRAIWSGSCPCQPFSVAGKGKGKDDSRHLWPDFFRLISACRPAVVVGEQVAGASGYGWFDGVTSDLAREDYSSRGVDVPACSVDAPHIRQRLYWVAVDNAVCGRHGDAQSEIRAGRVGIEFSSRSDVDMANAAGSRGREGECDSRFPKAWAPGLAYGTSDGLDMADADSCGCRGRQEASQRGEERRASAERTSSNGTYWSDSEWRVGADGKARRVKPDLCLLVDGFPNRVASLRVAGNAIVPQVAAEVIAALMEDLP